MRVLALLAAGARRVPRGYIITVVLNLSTTSVRLTPAPVAAVAAAQKTKYYGVTVISPPGVYNSEYPDCSAIYQGVHTHGGGARSLAAAVTLNPKYTVQGNDIGMLLPMGVNTTAFGGANYIGWPFPTDPIKQAAAVAQQSVTALTESTGHFQEGTDAYPLGFQTDTLVYDESICVYVKNVFNSYVEIMAETQNRAICVSDWGKADSAHNPIISTCAAQRLYQCRSSGNQYQSGGYTDTLALQFYCQGIGCSSSDFNFKWRIMARCTLARQPPPFIPCSDMPPDKHSGNTMQKDPYFCQSRKTTDYPSTLAQPFPKNYVAPAAATVTGSPSARTTTSLVALVLVGVAVVVALLF